MIASAPLLVRLRSIRFWKKTTPCGIVLDHPLFQKIADRFRFLGVDPTINYNDATGRPHPVLPSGRPIDELC